MDLAILWFVIYVFTSGLISEAAALSSVYRLQADLTIFDQSVKPDARTIHYRLEETRNTAAGFTSIKLIDERGGQRSFYSYDGDDDALPPVSFEYKEDVGLCSEISQKDRILAGLYDNIALATSVVSISPLSIGSLVDYVNENAKSFGDMLSTQPSVTYKQKKINPETNEPHSKWYSLVCAFQSGLDQVRSVSVVGPMDSPPDDNLSTLKKKKKQFELRIRYIENLQADLIINNPDLATAFTLPAAAGCSSLMGSTRALSIRAKQFSGIYEPYDSPLSARYVAFDTNSAMLRMDKPGEHRLIVELEQKRMTYMSTGSKVDTPIGQKPLYATSQVKTIAGTRCASTYMVDDLVDNIESRLGNVRAIDQILGMGGDAKIVKLGAVILDDGLQASLYEREIDAHEIPVLMRLHARIQISVTSRLFLLFYMIDESHIDKEYRDVISTELVHEHMWLRRVELVSKNSVSKYSILHARITFAEFTWSLESMSPDVGQQLAHPVQTFDLIDCVKSQSDVSNFEALIQPSRDAEIPKLAEDFAVLSEPMIVYLSKQVLQVTRSRINRLHLSISGDAENSDAIKLLVDATVIPVSDTKWQRSLAGWFEIAENSADNAGESRELVGDMSRLECALKMASESKDTRFYAIYCADLGCGRVANTQQIDGFVSAESVDATIKAQRPSPKLVYGHICEVYRLDRRIDAERSVGNGSPSKVRELAALISNTKIRLAADAKTNSEAVQFEGTFVWAAASRLIEHSAQLGAFLHAGSCYDRDRTNALQRDGGIGRKKLYILDLQLDSHQSLVDCHKACQLQFNCQTYSYDSKQRLCSLSDMNKNELFRLYAGVKMVEFRESRDCQLFAVNALHMYDSVTGLVAFMSMASLAAQNYYFASADLDHCANLCHTYEFVAISNKPGKRTHFCDRFKFYPMRSICAIHDPDSRLYNDQVREDAALVPAIETDASENANKLQHYIEVAGSESDWQKMGQTVEYRRDYLRHYSLEQNVKFDVPTGKSMVRHPILYDLSQDECLRECTIIRRNCVMLDYCAHIASNIWTRSCSLFLLEFNASAKTEAADLIESFNSIKITTKLKKQVGCTHFSLNSADLVLKMQLAQLKFDRDANYDQVFTENVRTSNAFLALIWEHHSSNKSYVILILTSVFGLGFGAALAWVVSKNRSVDPWQLRREAAMARANNYDTEDEYNELQNIVLDVDTTSCRSSFEAT